MTVWAKIATMGLSGISKYLILQSQKYCCVLAHLIKVDWIMQMRWNKCCISDCEKIFIVNTGEVEWNDCYDKNSDNEIKWDIRIIHFTA